jgi:hypothetical protein
MPTPIRIVVGQISVAAELSDTALAKRIAGELPIETTPNEWGDEFYFGIPVHSGLDETATSTVKVGDIGYWPPGDAMAIFFGPTPMSSGAAPVPASDVCLIGRITGDAAVLRNAKRARKIRIEKA